MALIVEKATKYGVNARYWRILAIEIQYGGSEDTFVEPKMFVTIGGYANKAARNAGASTLVTDRLMYEGADVIFDAQRKDVYPVLKARRFFEGASDDTETP